MGPDRAARRRSWSRSAAWPGSLEHDPAGEMPRGPPRSGGLLGARVPMKQAES